MLVSDLVFVSPGWDQRAIVFFIFMSLILSNQIHHSSLAHRLIFRSSSSADLLRDFLWTKRLEERQRIPVRGRNFLAGEDRNFRNLAAFLRWRGGYLLLMLPKAGYLVLYAAFFEGQAATIAVSNEPQHGKAWTKTTA